MSLQPDYTPMFSRLNTTEMPQRHYAASFIGKLWLKHLIWSPPGDLFVQQGVQECSEVAFLGRGADSYVAAALVGKLG
jgi:hypothetical protein